MIYNALIAFGPQPIQILDPVNGVKGVPTGSIYRKLFIQPWRGNKNGCYVGLSNVTNDGSGVGVIKDLADTGSASTIILDTFEYEVSQYFSGEDPSMIYVHGAAGDKVLVTIFT